jgi:TonB-dependent SusC/RagA subfamily outer membrane receptor
MSIAQYLLQLSVSLAVVFIFYKLFLSRLTFYTINRWYLLGYTFISFLIPFASISSLWQHKEVGEIVFIQWIPALTNSNAVQKLNSNELVLAYIVGIIVLGAVIMLIRLLFTWLSLRFLKQKATIISTDKTATIFQVQENIAPFSFGKNMYLNIHQHQGEDLEQIIKHEFVHIRQKHTLDVIWCEILCILNWYNPFAWMLKNAIKQNLEFIADDKVIQQGVDREGYQFLLLKVMGNRNFAIANNFNISALKKRIAMMNTNETGKRHLLKFVLMLPIVAILLLSFRTIHNEAVNDQRISPVVIITPAPAVKDTVPEKAVKVTVRGEANKTTTQADGEIKEKPKAVSIFTVRGVAASPNPPLYVLNGNIVDEGEFTSLNPNEIETINVMKGNTAESLYGKRGENGVIQITTKLIRGEGYIVGNKDQESGKIEFTRDGVAKKEEAKTLLTEPRIVLRGKAKGIIVNKTGVNADSDVLWIVDGKVVSEEEQKQLDPDTIKSITVLSNASGTSKYGSAAKNGVIEITLKEK